MKVLLMKKTNYFYDDNHVRYNLVSTNGKEKFNWLFFPGGPGADSCYFLDLVQILQLPGNAWLIDLPGNGNHAVQQDNFDTWLDIFLPTIKRFDNPIIVGHSFGGQLPLLFPELEDILAGLVLCNTAPCLWLEAAVDMAKELQLPDLSLEMQIFTENPTQETFNQALLACVPYYFPKETLAIGKKMLSGLPINFHPAVWWQRKVIENNFDAKWIPKHVPTLILGAEFDAITPFSLFIKDTRFDRDNMFKHLIHDAGHFPWLEKPEEIKKLFRDFLTCIDQEGKPVEYSGVK